MSRTQMMVRSSLLLSAAALLLLVAGCRDSRPVNPGTDSGRPPTVDAGGRDSGIVLPDSGGGGCVSNSECPSTEVCAGGACRGCFSTGECDTGEICTDGSCLPSECTSNAQCISTQVCSGGTCRDCFNTGECDAGETCVEGECIIDTPPSCDVTSEQVISSGLPPECLPRCTSASATAHDACSGDPDCTASVRARDTMPAISYTLDGMASTLDCDGCYNLQFNGCLYLACGDQYVAYLDCTDRGGTCDTEIMAVNNCISTSSAFDTCWSTRFPACFDI